MTAKTEQLGFRIAPRGVSVSRFLAQSGTIAARQEFTDSATFDLDADRVEAWEALDNEPAQDIAGLRELFERPTPFIA